MSKTIEDLQNEGRAAEAACEGANGRLTSARADLEAVREKLSTIDEDIAAATDFAAVSRLTGAKFEMQREEAALAAWVTTCERTAVEHARRAAQAQSAVKAEQIRGEAQKQQAAWNETVSAIRETEKKLSELVLRQAELYRLAQGLMAQAVELQRHGFQLYPLLDLNNYSVVDFTIPNGRDWLASREFFARVAQLATNGKRE